MSDEFVFSLIVMVVGIIGAVTGISGLILGYKGYKRSKNVKSLDLRLDFRKDINTLSNALIRLDKLIVDGNKSKQAIAAALGWFRFGRMESWKQDVENDKKKFDDLMSLSPKKTDVYDSLTEAQLETELVRIHDLQDNVNSLIKKYEQSLLGDKEDSKFLRQAALDRHRPN